LFLNGLFKDNEAEVIITNNKLTTQYEPVFKVAPEEPTEVNFVLENESGKVLLNVFISQIICFEANDNYVITYYMNKQNELKKSMERISLKKIEEILDGLGVSSFSRVHKSYLIHKAYIEEIKGKAQAQKIKLKNLELLVPVSRSFQVATLKTW
jgi:DNA-binding LytR/AlgR family response regulator